MVDWALKINYLVFFSFFFFFFCLFFRFFFSVFASFPGLVTWYFVCVLYLVASGHQRQHVSCFTQRVVAGIHRWR